MDRKGIELASSLIVILIVSIIIFGLAVGITYKILCMSEDKIDSFSAAQTQALEKRLATGPSVVAADASKDATPPSSICGGSATVSAQYLIGIRNDGVQPQTFTVACDPASLKRENPDGSLTTPSASDVTCNDLQIPQDSGQIAVSERKTMPIVVNVPSTALPGRYIIKLSVDGGDATKYLNLYLNVK